MEKTKIGENQNRGKPKQGKNKIGVTKMGENQKGEKPNRGKLKQG